MCSCIIWTDAHLNTNDCAWCLVSINVWMWCMINWTTGGECMKKYLYVRSTRNKVRIVDYVWHEFTTHTALGGAVLPVLLSGITF